MLKIFYRLIVLDGEESSTVSFIICDCCRVWSYDLITE